MSSSGSRQPRISGWQMSVLVFFAGSHIHITALGRGLAESAGPDSWLSLLLGNAVAAGILILAGSLSSRFPKKTFVEYSNDLAGTFIGTIFSFSLAIIFLGTTAMQVRAIGHFVKSSLLIITPMEVVIATMLIAVVYVLRLGLTSLARLGELLFPIFIVSALSIMVLSIPYVQFGKFAPILSKGWLPVLKGGLVIGTSTLSYGLPLFLVAFMSKPRDSISKGLLGIALSTLVTGGLALASIAIFGVAEASYRSYPTPEMARFIGLPGGILERIDVVVAFFLMIGIFLGLSIYFGLAVLILSRILGFREPGHLCLILLPVVYFLSLIPGTPMVMNNWSRKLNMAGFGLFTVTGIFFLLVAIIRKRGSLS